MTAELAVTETVTRRFIGSWALFSISVNTAVPRSFAAMESGRSDREPGCLVTPCGRPCGDLWPCLEKVDKLPAPFLPCLGRFGKTAPDPVDRECRAAKMGETGDGWQGRNMCRLKGGWLLQASSPGKRRPARPGGKERCHPGIRVTAKLGGIRKESAGNKAFVWVAWM